MARKDQKMIRSLLPMMAIVQLSIFSGFNAAAQSTKLHWLRVDFPPSFIIAGPYENQGYSDIATQIAIRNLPEYDHETVIVSPADAMRYLRTRPNFCGAGLSKNAERQTFMSFSQPSSWRRQNELVILKRHRTKFALYMDGQEKVGFANLLAKSDFLMGRHKGRSYGPNIDAILESAPPKKIYFRDAKDLTGGFLNMLSKERVDYIVESPDSVSWFAKYIFLDEEFLSFPLIEDQEALPVFFACSKSPLGQSVIEKLNRIIDTHKEDMTSAYRVWAVGS